MRNNSFQGTIGVFLALGLFAYATSANAQMQPGTAVAKSVKGSASYIDDLGSTHVLREGTVLKQGYTVQTGADGAVDLTMDQNGRLVGLFENTVLALDNLTYQPSVLGNIFDTRLDMKKGRVFVSVSKLLAGARYEVKTPQGIASVRGTEAYIDGITGQIWVVSGTVNFQMSLLDVLVGPPLGEHTEKRTISIPAGYSLFVTREIDMVNFRNGTLLPIPTGPPSQTVINRINASALGYHYNNPGNSSIIVNGAWFTELNGKQNVVNLVGTPALVVPSP